MGCPSVLKPFRAWPAPYSGLGCPSHHIKEKMWNSGFATQNAILPTTSPDFSRQMFWRKKKKRSRVSALWIWKEFLLCYNNSGIWVTSEKEVRLTWIFHACCHSIEVCFFDSSLGFCFTHQQITELLNLPYYVTFVVGTVKPVQKHLILRGFSFSFNWPAISRQKADGSHRQLIMFPLSVPTPVFATASLLIWSTLCMQPAWR